jgi:hypothetical protein
MGSKPPFVFDLTARPTLKASCSSPGQAITLHATLRGYQGGLPPANTPLTYDITM